jgi:hypothetical protein
MLAGRYLGQRLARLARYQKLLAARLILVKIMACPKVVWVVNHGASATSCSLSLSLIEDAENIQFADCKLQWCATIEGACERTYAEST